MIYYALLQYFLQLQCIFLKYSLTISSRTLYRPGEENIYFPVEEILPSLTRCHRIEKLEKHIEFQHWVQIISIVFRITNMYVVENHMHSPRWRNSRHGDRVSTLRLSCACPQKLHWERIFSIVTRLKTY